ncbi:uroporphyrinogen-III synthase [Haloechinothrix sp. LS1_15]|nr:uroporphyrinogen-III synthase [Haloechinothrix sp. LS1_15]
MGEAPAAAAGITPLTGYRIGITASRRAAELGALLVRQGAEVRYAPALRTAPVTSGEQLRAGIDGLIERPAEVLVAFTATGVRGWVDAAASWGMAGALLGALRGAEVHCRGPATAAAAAAEGLEVVPGPAPLSMAELLDRLSSAGVAGRRVAVLPPGRPVPSFLAALRAAGAEAVEIPVYRLLPLADREPVDRLVEDTVHGAIDALAFTSAAAAEGTLGIARRGGRERELTAAMRSRVLVAAVGPAAAGPLEEVGVSVVRPDRWRLGAMVHRLAADLAGRSPTYRVAGHSVQVRGQAVVVDGSLRQLAPAPMAVLRSLAARPGAVVPRRELLDCLPQGGEEHAVETAVGRLRSALGDSRMIETVVKRGYRLRVTRPSSDASPGSACSATAPVEEPGG